MSEPNPIRIGTSAFTANGWRGTFYPPGMKPADYLSYYATKFDTVEVDSTFYGTPVPKTVQNWYCKTPAGFMFAAKVPQIITHEKILHDCDVEMNEFLKVMDELREKLGPFLLQFGFFDRSVFPSAEDFLIRLLPFLDKLPKDHKFVVEIRNKTWLAPRFVDALRERGIALALVDQSWMPRPAQWFEKIDPITSDFTYVRLLGDRKGIEAQTKIWNKVVVDRSNELAEWLEILRKLKVPIYVYANNHYAGYGPATVQMFRDLWRRAVPMESERTRREVGQGQLFE